MYDAPGLSDAVAAAFSRLLAGEGKTIRVLELLSFLPPGFVAGAEGVGWRTLVPTLVSMPGTKALECAADGLEFSTRSASGRLLVDEKLVVKRLEGECEKGGEGAHVAVRVMR